MNLRYLPVILWVGLLLQGGPYALGQDNDGALIVPDKASQMLLDQLHSATTGAAAKAAIEEIKTKTNGNIPSLFPQVICYRADIKRKLAANLISSQEAEKLLAGTYALFKEIAPTPDAARSQDWKLGVVEAISPYLGTTNLLQKEQSKWVLEKLDYKGARGRDYSSYTMFLKKRKDAANRELVAYMYDQDPKTAVLTMVDVYADATTKAEMAGRLKDDSEFNLDYFADRPEWWAHLYVAEMMKKRPELRDTAILKKLEKDDHPLVKEKVAEITSGK